MVTPVTHETESLVVRCATYNRRCTGNGSRMSFEPCYLCSVEPNDGSPYLLTFAGLYHRVASELASNNIRFETKILMQKQLTANVDLLTDEDLRNLVGRDDQAHVLGLVSDHPGGFIVDAPTGWGKSYIIAQVCQMLPSHRIAVISPGKEVTRMLYLMLKRRIREVGQVGDGQNQISRITVSTAESMMKLRHNDWDLLLFDEVHRAGAPATANAISEVFKTAKCVGFSASPTGRSDGADLVVEALFGPVIYKVNYATSVNRGDIAPIKVKAYVIQKGAPVMTDKPVVRNRHGLWRNELRNSFIAKLANDIPGDEQALIMCSTAEHVLYLYKWLPNFDLIFSDMTKKLLEAVYRGEFGRIEGLDSTGSITAARRAYMRKEFEAGRMKRVIATGIWNTGVNFTQLRWLIRADGMSSDIQSIQTPGRLSRVSDGKSHGTLIDFIDEFDPVLAGRSTARLRRYRKNGWTVEEVRDPDLCIDTFTDMKRRRRREPLGSSSNVQ